MAARFGVLATISFLIILNLGNIPFATDLSAWYAGNFILFMVIVVGLTLYGFYTSIAGAKVFGEKSFLGD